MSDHFTISPILTFSFLEKNRSSFGMRSVQESCTKLLSSYFSSYSSSFESFGKKSTSFSNNISKKQLPSCLVSNYSFSLEDSTITISFYYYIGPFGTSKETISGQNLFSVNTTLKEDLLNISLLLSNLLGKEVILKATQLHYPYLESTIFAKYLAHNASSSTFLHFQEAILSFPSFYFSSLPSHITGMKIQLSGRITTEAVVPRLTVKSSLFGSFSSVNQYTTSYNNVMNQFYVDYGKYTTKNELGAFTIKVWIANKASQ